MEFVVPDGERQCGRIGDCGGGHKKASGASGLDKLPEFLTQNVREWTKFN